MPAARVLVVAERPAVPCVDGARLRIFSLLRALEGYAIDFIHFAAPGSLVVPVDSELRHCKTLAVVYHHSQISTWNRALSVFSSRPNGERRTDSSEMRRVLADLPKGRYAFALVCGLNMAQYGRWLPVAHAVVDLCDSEVRHMEVRSNFAGNPATRCYFRWQRRKTLTAMSHAAERYDKWLVISDVERESVREHFPDMPIYVVPNAVAALGVPRAGLAKKDRLIVLSGNFEYYPNVDAALHFARTVMPLIRAERPGCSLRILGRDPPDPVKRLRSDDVEVTGFVGPFVDYLSEASVFVCPLRLGTGIKNKVLQAMALGVPVVSTRVGVEGLGLSGGYHYMDAETPGEFLRAIGLLLDSPGLAFEIAECARQFVLQRFSPRVVADSLRVALLD